MINSSCQSPHQNMGHLNKLFQKLFSTWIFYYIIYIYIAKIIVNQLCVKTMQGEQGFLLFCLNFYPFLFLTEFVLWWLLSPVLMTFLSEKAYFYIKVTHVFSFKGQLFNTERHKEESKNHFNLFTQKSLSLHFDIHFCTYKVFVFQDNVFQIFR